MKAEIVRRNDEFPSRTGLAVPIPRLIKTNSQVAEDED